MEYLTTLFNDLDGIIKGAVGSALCLLIVWIIQLIFKYASRLVELTNKTYRKRALQAEWTPLNAIDSVNKEMKILSYILCLYPALHKLIKAFIFILIGFWAEEYNEIFSSSAYACALYYLFVALSYVPDLGSFGNKDARSARLAEINKKFDEMS